MRKRIRRRIISDWDHVFFFNIGVCLKLKKEQIDSLTAFKTPVVVGDA